MPTSSKNTVEIRPIWERLSSLETSTLPSYVTEIHSCERNAVNAIQAAVLAARQLYDDERVDNIEPIVRHALADFVAGCELVRAGYIRQAYALWRSWLEQVVFALYFLEAPLHLAAWKRVEKVSSGSEPPYKLMLHEILKKGGEKPHPFAVVYNERFKSLYAALKVSPPSKRAPLTTATELLGDLSQGVHGTFQPEMMTSDAELSQAYDKHIKPLLGRLVALVGFLCFVCLQSRFEFSEAQWTKMRDRRTFPEIDNAEEELAYRILPALWLWLDSIEDK